MGGPCVATDFGVHEPPFVRVAVEELHYDVVCACAFCCPFCQGQANGHLPQEESGCLYSLIDHDWHNMMPAISCPMLIFLRATTEPQKRIAPWYVFRPDCPVALPYSMFFDTFASIFHNLSTCPWHVKHQTWFSILSVQTWLLKEIAVVIVIVIVIALHLSWSLQLSLSLSDLLTNSAISSDFLFQYIARLRSFEHSA